MKNHVNEFLCERLHWWLRKSTAESSCFWAFPTKFLNPLLRVMADKVPCVHICGKSTKDFVHVLEGFHTSASGGSKGGPPHPHPPRLKIFSILCSFWENLTKSYVGGP